MWDLSCTTNDLVPWLRTKPRPPALWTQSLSHWTTRKVPVIVWLWDQGDPGLVEWVWKGSFLFNVLYISPVKPSGPGFLFVGSLLIIDSLSYWVVIGLFIFYISFWVSLRRLYVLGIYPFILGCLFHWCAIVYHNLLQPFVFLWLSAVTSFIFFLISWII